MLPSDEFKKYSEQVTDQIRYKNVKPRIANEIEVHLVDQRNAYQADGMDEELATKKAILQMGDPVAVGQGLDKINRPKQQWLLLSLAAILMLVGLLVSLSTDSATSPLLYIFSGGILALCYLLDFSILGKHPVIIYFGILAISVASLCLATAINGKLFLTLYRFTIPLSCLSLVFPFVFALLVYGLRNRGYLGIILCGVGFVPPMIILILAPTISGALLYAISSLVILCVAIGKGWFCVNKKAGLMLVLIPTGAVSTFLLVWIMNIAPHIFNILINPHADPKGSGWLYLQLRELLSGAQFIGTGAENPAITPLIHSEYPLMYLVIQYGIIVLLGIVLLLAVFAVIGFVKAHKQKNVLGSLIALATMLTFALQSIFYIADNLGYGFISSLSLPFISGGRSSLLIYSVLVGFMLSAFKTEKLYPTPRFLLDKKLGIFSYNDGKLTINFGALKTISH